MMYRGPSVDHTFLSPSGKVSKRARRAAEKITRDLLFPPGYWDVPEIEVSEREKLEKEIKYFREYSGRGIPPRRAEKEIAKLQAKLNALRGTP